MKLEMIGDFDPPDAPPVERRGEARGVFPGLRARVLEGPGEERVLEVIEASRQGFFLLASDPDAFPVGSVLEVRLAFHDLSAEVGVKVVRKELAPRSGVAVHICRVTADEKLTYRRILLGLA